MVRAVRLCRRQGPTIDSTVGLVAPQSHTRLQAVNQVIHLISGQKRADTLQAPGPQLLAV